MTTTTDHIINPPSVEGQSLNVFPRTGAVERAAEGIAKLTRELNALNSIVADATLPAKIRQEASQEVRAVTIELKDAIEAFQFAFPARDPLSALDNKGERD
jgi:uncharacterized protein (UPF0147 family)